MKLLIEDSIASRCADVVTRAEAEEDGDSGEDSSEDDADNGSLEENQFRFANTFIRRLLEGKIK